MKVVFSTQARVELRDIALFIARDNKTRAISFVQELRERARALGDMPHAFPLVPRYEHHGVRRRVHGDYSIFYRVVGQQVFVLHVLHGARDYEAILR